MSDRDHDPDASRFRLSIHPQPCAAAGTTECDHRWQRHISLVSLLPIYMLTILQLVVDV
jgi:hypothetical protein